MPDHTNIELFRIYTGATFAVLYGAFPFGRQLDAEEIVQHCQLAGGGDDFARHIRLVEEAWRWLQETGFLHFDPNTNRFDLTPRSFEGLTFLDNPSDGVCRGDRLRQLSTKVASSTIAETIAEIVVRILGSGSRAVYSFYAAAA